MRPFELAPLAVAVAAAFVANGAFALPTGAEIRAGQGAVTSPSVKSVVVRQDSARLAIDWQSFGIAAGESVRFVQPSASSIALNRVLGNNRSEIFGNLSANGQVFLINPNGVLFGRTAQVDVGGLVASTLDISTADFMAGRTTFSGGNGGAVVNQGRLSAASGGYVALLGPRVSNEGVIEARMGTVALAAGNQVTLNFGGNSLVGLSVDRGVVGALAENHQLIQADGGRVLLSARAADDVVRAVVNNTGVIEANSISTVNGFIRLEGLGASTVTSTGTLRARGEEAGTTGGRVEMLGERVGLMAGGQVDASGSAGGGTVLVGGDWQGRNPDIQNAFRTYVAPDAAIKADAIEKGDGGRVVVWSDDATRYYGWISAKGGASGGNGGFVEVSGKRYLDFHGSVGLGAPNGRGGELLLDPADIIVAAAAGTLDGELNGSGDPTIAFADAAASTTLNVTELTTGFGSFNTITLQATNNIRIDTNVTLQPDVMLVLEAGNDINIGTTANAAVTAQGFGALTLRADANGPNGTGSINIGSASTTGSLAAEWITLKGADVNIHTTNGTVSGGIGSEMQFFTSRPSTATIGVGAATGTMTLSNAELGRITAGTLVFGDSAAQVGNITFTGATPGSGRNVTAAQLTSGAGAIVLNDTGSVVPLTTGAGNISLSAGTGGITANATNTTAELSTSGIATLNTSSPVGTSSNRIQFSTTMSVTPSRVDIGDVTPSTSGVYLGGLGDGLGAMPFVLGSVATGGSAPLDVTAEWDITQQGVGGVNVAGTARFESTGAGNIMFNFLNNVFHDTVTPVTGGAVHLRQASAIYPLKVAPFTASSALLESYFAGNGELHLAGNYDFISIHSNNSFSIAADTTRLIGDTAITASGAISIVGNVAGPGGLQLNQTGAPGAGINIDASLGVSSVPIGPATVQPLAGLTIHNVAGALTLGEVNVNGNVDITALTYINSNGAMTVAGTSRFESTSAGAILLLGDNAFQDTVTLVTGGEVQLRQSSVFPLKVAPFTTASPATLSSIPHFLGGGEMQLSGSYESTLRDFKFAAVTTRLTGNTRITAAQGITIGGDVVGPGALHLEDPSSTFFFPTVGTFPLTRLGTSAEPLGGLIIHGNSTGGTTSLFEINVNGNVEVVVPNQIIVNNPISAAGVGNAIVVATTGAFVNNAGAGAFSTPNDRWLVYSDSPAGSTENGLVGAAGSTMPRLYNRNYVANAPASISEPGSHLIYISQPTLNVSANSLSRAYGDPNPAFSASFSGFVNDDGVMDNAVSAGVSGSAAFLAPAGNLSVSGSPYAITPGVGSLASSAGYAFAFVDGQLTVAQRPVTVTADAAQTKVYGNPDPGAYTFANTSLGSGVALAGALDRAAGENVGNHAIGQGTLTNANNPNYLLTYIGDNFTIIGQPPPAVLAVPAVTAINERVRVAIVDADQQGREKRGSGGQTERQGIYRLIDGGIKLPEGER